MENRIGNPLYPPFFVILCPQLGGQLGGPSSDPFHPQLLSAPAADFFVKILDTAENFTMKIQMRSSQNCTFKQETPRNLMKELRETSRNPRKATNLQEEGHLNSRRSGKLFGPRARNPEPEIQISDCLNPGATLGRHWGDAGRTGSETRISPSVPAI